MPRQLPSSTQLSPAPQHFASRQAPPIPRCLRAEPKINGCLFDASLDKPRFALKAQVLQIALPPPPPWLAHLCSLKFAQSSASATTLAAHICLRLSARLPWLAPSCEKAMPQQQPQVREWMTQLAVTGMANVIFTCSAAQLNIAKGRCFTESGFLCCCFSLSSTAGNTPS